MAVREFKSCLGITPEGVELTSSFKVPDGMIVFYCSECGNPLGTALNPDVKIIRFKVKNAVFNIEPKREYPQWAVCMRCKDIVKLDWRELETYESKGGDQR